MTWLHLSLIPPMIWGIVNTIDKIVVEKYVTKAMVYLVFTGIASIIPIAILPALVQINRLPVSYLLLSILTGILYIIYTYFFFKALTISDASSPKLNSEGWYLSLPHLAPRLSIPSPETEELEATLTWTLGKTLIHLLLFLSARTAVLIRFKRTQLFIWPI